MLITNRFSYIVETWVEEIYKNKIVKVTFCDNLSADAEGKISATENFPAGIIQTMLL
jgi:hypothetical protein